MAQDLNLQQWVPDVEGPPLPQGPLKNAQSQSEHHSQERVALGVYKALSLGIPGPSRL